MSGGLACFLAMSLMACAPSAVDGPDALLKQIMEMSWTGSGAQALEIFKKAEAEELKDPNLWFKLGMALYDGRSYRPSFACFRRIADEGSACCALLKFGAAVWQGHLYDLLGRRADALICYRRAMALEKRNKGLNMRHDQYGMILDRAWVAKRLKAPFVR